MISGLVSFCLRRRRLLVSIFLGIFIFGVYSASQLSIDAYPDISDTTVQVLTQYPGRAAEEVETQITIPLERELNGVPNLKIMRSKSTFALSIIQMVFQEGTDDYFARQRVLERVNNVTLPPNVQAASTRSPPPMERFTGTLCSPVCEVQEHCVISTTGWCSLHSSRCQGS
jgi:cobalt-zinc-cadmium resistance protein CzcA